MRSSNSGLVPALALIAAIAATPAAALTYTTSPGAPDPGAGAATVLVDFNGSLPDGYTLSGSYGYANGTSGAAASPAGDTSRYFYTSSALGSGVATLQTFDLSSVSFYWGSIDSYNSVEVLGAGGVTLATVGGSAFAVSNGNQSAPVTNQRIFFNTEGDEVITGLRFTATGVAFEIDNVAGVLASGGSGSTVPEPATWAMLVGGFGLVGAGARRRRNTMARVTV